MKDTVKQYPVTTVLVIINLIMFVICEVTGGSESTTVLLKWGALYAPLSGENWYRVITAAFLHAGIRHLLNNMILLSVLGSLVEKMTGKIRYVIIYLASGILANVFTAKYYELKGENLVLIGASGCIFGLMGALIWIVICNKGRVEDMTVQSMFLMAALSLYFGFASSGTANAAHVFGIIFGFVLTVIFYRKGRRVVY